MREECLDRIVILGERHLHRVLTTYVDYYNHARPHQGLEQECPVSLVRSTARDGPVERRTILGGLLHDYYRRARSSGMLHMDFSHLMGGMSQHLAQQAGQRASLLAEQQGHQDDLEG